ncbi:reverse transcriptase domain-containing protein [Tanacetum coccineum]|uniref:Reverse transcriptase domain-containing protein n=1 Tax=Tanacetum coccineum TaxID=301880 RepID=A0ABQ5E3L5_9ASTR
MDERCSLEMMGAGGRVVRPKFKQMVKRFAKEQREARRNRHYNQLDRTSALADSGASINLLPHSIYKQLGLGALKPTRMTLELANRSITHPMGIAEDVVVRVDVIILEVSADELTLLKKDVQEGNFQDHSNPLFEFDDKFKSSTINPLFDEMEEDVEIKNSNVSDEPVLLNTPLSDKVECFAPEDDIDEIDAFLAMEVSSNFEEGYFDSEGDVTFLDNLLSDDASHNLASEVISDHDPEQNESSITFSPRSDPLHHEFAGELLTLPSRNDREFGEYLSLMTVLCEISTSQSQENVHANQNDLIPPGVENDDSEDEDNELPNLDHQDDPSIPRPPPEPPDVEKCFEPEAGILIIKEFKGVSKSHDFMADILPTLVSDLTFILFLSSFLSFGSEDTIFDPGIITFSFFLSRAGGIFNGSFLF